MRHYNNLLTIVEHEKNFTFGENINKISQRLQDEFDSKVIMKKKGKENQDDEDRIIVTNKDSFYIFDDTNSACFQFNEYIKENVDLWNEMYESVYKKKNIKEIWFVFKTSILFEERKKRVGFLQNLITLEVSDKFKKDEDEVLFADDISFDLITKDEKVINISIKSKERDTEKKDKEKYVLELEMSYSEDCEEIEYELINDLYEEWNSRIEKIL